MLVVEVEMVHSPTALRQNASCSSTPVTHVVRVGFCGKHVLQLVSELPDPLNPTTIVLP